MFDDSLIVISFHSHLNANIVASAALLNNHVMVRESLGKVQSNSPVQVFSHQRHML
jgi:hypothetical protein